MHPQASRIRWFAIKPGQFLFISHLLNSVLLLQSYFPLGPGRRGKRKEERAGRWGGEDSERGGRERREGKKSMRGRRKRREKRKKEEEREGEEKREGEEEPVLNEVWWRGSYTPSSQQLACFPLLPAG